MRAGGRRAAIAWCLYDWANSAFPTVVSTFVIAAYFTRAVAESPEKGQSQWAWAMALAGLAVAVLAPVLGGLADRVGPRKPWLAGFTLLAAAASAGLWVVRPDAASVLPALVLVAVGSIGFEMALVFYNAMLPEVAATDRMGRLSGWAWGLGYAGGLTCLLIALFGLVRGEPPPFGLDPAAAESVRATGFLVAAWMLAFAVPLFLWVPDRGRVAPEAVPGWRRILRLLRQRPDVTRFLVARLLYTDGLNTLFAFGGIYAAGTFDMTVQTVMAFGIAMNVAAGLGAAAFAWVDDWLGSRRTVTLGLMGMMTFGAILLVISGKVWFWVFALPLGIFFGPVQAASRTLLARLAPPESRAELYGLYALSGKITAFAGPAVLGWVTAWTASQRAGMATILLFLGGGLWVLWRTPLTEKHG